MEDIYHKIQLPTQGRLYEGDPEIGIRPFKGKDEKLLVELNYDNFEKRMDKVLQNVVQGIEPKELTLGDRLYILLWERINSYSQFYEIERVCESCGTKQTTTVDLSKLDQTGLPDSYTEPYQITLEDESTLDLRLLRVRDEMEAYNYEKAGKSSWLIRMALSIVDDSSIVEREKFLEELPGKDIAKIRAFHEKFNHGPVMELETTCKLCDEEGTAHIPFRHDFVYPDARTIRRHFGDGI